MIVSESFVRQILGVGNALGRRIRYVPEQDQAYADTAKPGRWFEIVGVSSDLQRNPVDPTLVRPAVWYAVAPNQAHLAQSVDLAIRLRRPTTPADFVPTLRRIATAVDPALRLGRTYSMAEFEKESQLTLRLVGLGVGLVIAAARRPG